MSMKYKKSIQVPSKVLCERLEDLSLAASQGEKAITREFGIYLPRLTQVPAEYDYDADLVLAEASSRIKRLLLKVERLNAELAEVIDDYEHLRDNAND